MKRMQPDAPSPSPAEPAMWFLGRSILRNVVSGEPPSTAARPEVVRLADVFDAGGLRGALLTAMVVDEAWVARVLLPPGLPTVLVCHWDAQQTPAGPAMHALSDSMILVRPPLERPGLRWGATFHSKLALLWYDDRLRVVVSSANLTRDDWTELGQVLWAQDFPLAAAGSAKRLRPDAPFSSSFRDVLLRDALHPMLRWDAPAYSESDLLETVDALLPAVRSLRDYDFSRAGAILVASAPGVYPGLSEHVRVGIPALRRAFGAFLPHPAASAGFHATYQASALGALTDRFVQQLRQSWLSGCAVCAKRPQPPLRVLFPDAAHAERIRDGRHPYGATVLIQSAPHRQCAGVAVVDVAHKARELDDVALHSKVLWVRHPATDEARLYIGSHNMSGGAWGSYVGSGGLHISNYELGVVLHARGARAVERLAAMLPISAEVLG